MLKNINRVIIDDYSEYVSGKSANGGCYSFTNEYTRIQDTNRWNVSYFTSCELVPDETNVDVITTDDVVYWINHYQNQPEVYITLDDTAECDVPDFE